MSTPSKGNGGESFRTSGQGQEPTRGEETFTGLTPARSPATPSLEGGAGQEVVLPGPGESCGHHGEASGLEPGR